MELIAWNAWMQPDCLGKNAWCWEALLLCNRLRKFMKKIILWNLVCIFIGFTTEDTALAQGEELLPDSQDIPSSLMTFFVTSEPIGDGGNLGGLAGADAHCQALASAVGAGDRTWRAYLSTQARPGQPAINARDRIGTGPWYNFDGVMVARDLSLIHI